MKERKSSSTGVSFLHKDINVIKQLEGGAQGKVFLVTRGKNELQMILKVYSR